MHAYVAVEDKAVSETYTFLTSPTFSKVQQLWLVLLVLLMSQRFLYKQALAEFIQHYNYAVILKSLRRVPEECPPQI